MRNQILFVLFCIFSYRSNAQSGSFNLSAVPEQLKTKAAVIMHKEDIELDVESLEKGTLKVHKIFTVLNEDGKDALLFNEFSTKYLSLDDAEIKVFDQNGKQVGRYKKKEMVTVAVGDGLIQDGYVTYYKIIPPSYPVTVELKFEQKLKSTLSIPDYDFIHPKEAVIESSYTAKVPSEIGLRYKSKNSNVTPIVTEDGKNKIYKWAVKELPAMENEEGSAAGKSKLPYVEIVTDQFSHYGYHGNLSSWKEFGSWINELYAGLDSLTPARQQFFQQMVLHDANENEKIKHIYKYLQDNFRYVSIQLGIGGLQPLSAMFTDDKKYGDCKGLSNYMKAALKAVGIKSHVAIINAEYNMEPVDPDFPANNFNHVILCVPGKKDTTWLECTSSTAEYGKLGTFTENRNALLITDQGGVLVATPKSESSTNSISTRTTVTLEDDLSAMTETVMNTKGEFSEMMMDLMKEKKDDQKEMIVFYLGYKEPDDFIITEDGTNKVHRLKMVLRKLPDFNSGNKYFINSRINKLWSVKLPTAEKRKSDYYFRYPFEKSDTTIIKLTPDFKPDVLPEPSEINSRYTSYNSRIWYNEAENAIYTSTKLVLKKHKIPAADYAEVKTFFDNIAQEDAKKIIIKKSEGGSKTEKKAF